MTASASLAPLAPQAARIAAMAARLDSDHAGERDACLTALQRLLHRYGLRFVDLAAAIEAALEPAPNDHGCRETQGDDGEMVQRALHADFLTVWERAFVAQLAQRITNGQAISDRQREVLAGIVAQRCV